MEKKERSSELILALDLVFDDRIAGKHAFEMADLDERKPTPSGKEETSSRYPRVYKHARILTTWY